MKLTIISEDNVLEQEVNADMEVQDVLALVAAEAELPQESILLSDDSGNPLSQGDKTLQSYGLTGDSTLFLTLTNQAASSSSNTAQSQPQSLQTGFPSSDADLERMRLQALGDPRLMSELRSRDPEMAEAVASGQRFKEMYIRQQTRMRQAKNEKGRMIDALNSDPYDIDAQKRIEEAIRMERVLENMEHAMEYSPESFGNVHMLYINVEVNGHPVKAFVDSGAQATIISPDCAERCGIMRLLDTRYAGVAQGVGTARILGRIHSAQIKLDSLFLPCAFSVLEGKSVELLFGLDMLKRHQCCIDLGSNVLRINTTEIPFLPEHELPPSARRMEEAELAEAMAKSSAEGVQPAVATTAAGGFPGSGNALGTNTISPPAGGSATQRTASAPQVASGHSEEAIQTLIGLGTPRDHAIQLLDATGGNVDMAAAMLFG